MTDGSTLAGKKAASGGTTGSTKDPEAQEDLGASMTASTDVWDMCVMGVTMVAFPGV